MCVLNNAFSLFLNSAFLLEMILSDSTGSIEDKMGAWIWAGVEKIGLVLKTNSKQMGRAAGGRTRLIQSSRCSLFVLCPVLRTWAPVPCFPPATRLPLSHWFLLSAALFPQLARSRADLLTAGHVSGTISEPSASAPVLRGA